METHANDKKLEKRLDGYIYAGKIVRRTALYSLAFEGLTRIAEAYLPPGYSEMARSARHIGEMIEGCTGAVILGFSPFLAIGVYLNNKYWCKQ